MGRYCWNYLKLGGRTFPLRAQSPVLRGSWRVPEPSVRSCDSRHRPPPRKPPLLLPLSWSTFPVSHCSSWRHRWSETAR